MNLFRTWAHCYYFWEGSLQKSLGFFSSDKIVSSFLLKNENNSDPNCRDFRFFFPFLKLLLLIFLRPGSGAPPCAATAATGNCWRWQPRTSSRAAWHRRSVLAKSPLRTNVWGQRVPQTSRLLTLTFLHNSHFAFLHVVSQVQVKGEVFFSCGLPRAVLREAERASVTLDAYGYGALLDGCAAAGDPGSVRPANVVPKRQRVGIVFFNHSEPSPESSFLTTASSDEHFKHQHVWAVWIVWIYEGHLVRKTYTATHDSFCKRPREVLMSLFKMKPKRHGFLWTAAAAAAAAGLASPLVAGRAAAWLHRLRRHELYPDARASKIL